MAIMRKGCSPQGGESPVSIDDARGELARLLADRDFRCAERNKKFLQFASEAFFAGREDALKAYSIAVDVFGRPETFDPAVDPIVRIEATRLRSALIQYYELNGRSRDILIELPKGRYIPRFVRNHLRTGMNADPIGGASGGKVNAPPWWRKLYRRARDMPAPKRTVGAAVVAAMLLLASGLLWDRVAVVISERPVISVLLDESRGQASPASVAIRDALISALLRFDTVRLATPEATVSRARANSALGDGRSRYTIILRYLTEGDGKQIWWQLLDQQTGEVLRSGEEGIANVAEGSANSEERVVFQLAHRLASYRGIINTAEAAKDPGQPTLGHRCILRAMQIVAAPTELSLAQARSCLERTLELRPYDPDAHAMLVAVLLAGDPLKESASDRSLASTHAERALALAPDSDRSYVALMLSAFWAGKPGAAANAGRRAIELNPGNVENSAKFARLLFLTGAYGESVALARSAMQFSAVPLREAEWTLAFDEYRRGDFIGAVSRLENLSEPACYLSQLLLAASYAQIDRIGQAATVISRLRTRYPGFEWTFYRDMEVLRIAPGLVAALGEGLRLASLSLK